MRTEQTAGHIAAALAMALWFGAAPRADAQGDGIYADFTTSMGSFTCRLEYAKAPKAVANFIGLATGGQAWMDPVNGQTRSNAFYNGLTFHRVIPDFMIQGGSRNGEGTDGPGYIFPDEFDPTLRHDGPGVLSMANSGPRSNGSQFFVTVAATPWLDDVHTVFGRVVTGQSVVDAISQVPRDGNDRPLTPVVLQNVGIRRVGAAALAFNVATQNLPVVSNARTWWTGAAPSMQVAQASPRYFDSTLFFTADFNAWNSQHVGVDTAKAVTNSLGLGTLPQTNPRLFFLTGGAQYPIVPAVANRVLTLLFDDGLGTLIITFNGTGGGTYTYNGGTPGTVSSYTWDLDLYRGYLWPIYYDANLAPMTLQLEFPKDRAGPFAGTAYLSETNLPVSGTFTLSP